MRKINILVAFILAVGFTACSKDDSPTLKEVESKKVTNLHAPQQGFGSNGTGPFTKFDFETGQTTTSDTDWDIAFRGTTIIVNGGTPSGTADEPTRNGEAAAYIASGTLASVKSVETSKLKQDSSDGLAITTGSGNGWYTYTGEPKHQIVPTAGKILVFKTRNGKHAKVEILSYYKDNDASNPANGRYFTFNYVFNPNTGVTNF